MSLAEVLEVNKLKLAWSKNHIFGLNVLKKLSTFLTKFGYNKFSSENIEKHV
jgi:hypothetical protein